MTTAVENLDLKEVLNKFFNILHAALIGLMAFYVFVVYFAMELHSVAMGGALFTVLAASMIFIKNKFGLRAAIHPWTFFGFCWQMLFIYYTGGAFSPAISWVAVMPFLAGIFLGVSGAVIWGCISLGTVCTMLIFRDALPATVLSAEKQNWFLLSAFVGIFVLLLVTLKFGDMISTAKIQKETKEKDSLITRIAAKLGSTEKSFKTIFENSPIGIATMDANLNFITVNPAIIEFLGYSTEELRHISLNELTHEDDRDYAMSSLLETSSSESELKRFEKRYFNKSGNLVWGAFSGRAMKTESGAEPLLFAVIEDITELKELELKRAETEGIIRYQQAKLVASAKMSALGEMAGGIAHEINNPLAIIQGMSSQIKRKLENGKFDIDHIKVDFGKIEKTVQRIAKIIKGLRSFSRDSEADPMEPAKLSQIVEDTLELCKEKFRALDIELKHTLEVDQDLTCRATQITQILMNLLGNASDAVEKLEERWVNLNISSKNERVIFTITDSGKGIPTDVVEKMMNPFYTTKEIGKGTGLGLSISKGIAEEHQGKLFYDKNCPNTQFVLELPLVPTVTVSNPGDSKVSLSSTNLKTA